MSWFKNWPTLTELFFGTEEKKKNKTSEQESPKDSSGSTAFT